MLVKDKLQVRVVMTPSATRLISPATFRSLTGYPVGVELFEDSHPGEGIKHIDLATFPDMIVVAPATANTLAKLAAGLADNLLTAVLLAAGAPVVLVPSMNPAMYENPALQHNLKLLRSRGFQVMEPAEGELACGAEGKGRMPEPGEIYTYLRELELKRSSYRGVKALVTAGPTREALDPVRFISNRSSGKMGYTLARALQERGAEVCLVSGPTGLPAPEGVELVKVETAAEMLRQVLKRYAAVDLVIKAAAVSDYSPAVVEDHKVKKRDRLLLELKPTPDILRTLGENKEGQVLVGFAAETGDLLEKAGQKLKSKNLDLIVANDVTGEGAGFEVDTNLVKIIHRDGRVVELPLMSKLEVSHRLLEEILPLLHQSRK